MELDDIEREDFSLDTLIPDNANQPYDMHEIIRKTLDEGDFFEIQPNHAANIICGFGRVEGRTVGVVANQPMVLAGVLDIIKRQSAARKGRAVDEDELKQAMEIEEKRLGGTFDELANRSGWEGTEELEMRLGARIQRENYLKKKILADVSEEEARAWYEERKDEFVSPERRKVKWRSHDEGEFQEEWVDTSKLPKEIAEGVFKLSVGAQENLGGYEIELLEIKEARSDATHNILCYFRVNKGATGSEMRV